VKGDVLEMASDVRIGGAVWRGRGEAESNPVSDEDRHPRPQPRSTGLTSTSRTARCGPACRVVWEGRGRKVPPYPDSGRSTKVCSVPWPSLRS
jgi:hypothetical protein